MKVIFQKLFLIILFFSKILIAEGFLAETLVFTPDGYKPIEQLHIDDPVFCFNEAKQLMQKPITFIKKKTVSQYALLLIDDICIGVDSQQKFYSQEQNKWVKVADLTINEHLVVDDYKIKKIENIRWLNKQAEVYLITVADYHNFCVSTHNIHTHNFVPIVIGFSMIFGLGGVELSAITGGIALGGLLFGYAKRKNKFKNEEFENCISVQVAPSVKQTTGCVESQDTTPKTTTCFPTNENLLKNIERNPGFSIVENDKDSNVCIFSTTEVEFDVILTKQHETEDNFDSKNQTYLESKSNKNNKKVIKKRGIKGLIKEKKLPTKGKIRYIPPKNHHITEDLPKGIASDGSKGFLDKFGNIWVSGESRTKGQAFEWDVQLSSQGKAQLGWMTRDNKHLNVSLDGKVTHK